MIVVAGLGLSGSYLLKRLDDEGFEARGFDPRIQDFYVPCGYATNIRKLRDILRSVNLNADDYVEHEGKEVTISGPDMPELTFSSAGICTIDKNRLEKDLISGQGYERTRAKFGPGDTVIDATGVSRYYLGKAENDFLMYTKEYVTAKAGHSDFHFRYFSRGTGYYWEFPLKKGFHVGAGADGVEAINQSLAGFVPERVLSRKIRLKPLFDQMFNRNIIGTGESIGTVSPITGEGIIPSLVSAEILVRCLKEAADVEELKVLYGKRIRDRFAAYTGLFDLLTASRNGKLLTLGNIRNARYAKADFEGFGIDLKIWKIIRRLIPI